MEERQITIEGETPSCRRPCMVIATQNPVETEGTFPLAGSAAGSLLVPPVAWLRQREDTREILRRFRTGSPLEQVKPVITVDEIAAMQRDVTAVHVSPAVEEYIIDLTAATRHHRSVETGLSPRAMIALLRSAQASAYLDGRTYVLPDDVKAVFPALAVHRIRLSMEAELHVTEQEVIDDILKSVAAPVEEGV